MSEHRAVRFIIKISKRCNLRCGGVWGHGEAYQPELKYGNLVNEDLGAILTSGGRRRAIHNASLETRSD